MKNRTDSVLIPSTEQLVADVDREIDTGDLFRYIRHANISDTAGSRKKGNGCWHTSGMLAIIASMDEGATVMDSPAFAVERLIGSIDRPMATARKHAKSVRPSIDDRPVSALNVETIATSMGADELGARLKLAGVDLRRVRHWMKVGIGQRHSGRITEFCRVVGCTVSDLQRPDFEVPDMPPLSSLKPAAKVVLDPYDMLDDLLESELRDVTISRLAKLHAAL